MGSSIVLLDTNVIVRYLIADDKELFNQAKEVFNNAQNSNIRLFIESFVFVEVIYVLSSFYKIDRNLIKISLIDLFSYKNIIIDQSYVDALEIYSSTNMHIVDCLLAAKSLLGSQNIITFDKELSKFISKSSTKI